MDVCPHENTTLGLRSTRRTLLPGTTPNDARRFSLDTDFGAMKTTDPLEPSGRSTRRVMRGSTFFE